MATKIEQGKMATFLKVVLGPLRSEVSVVEPAGNRCFHISTDPNIKEFKPMVSKRTIQVEDRSVPRVCVGTTLWDCLIGYSATVMEFIDRPDGESVPGGYHIYSLPTKLLLKPTTKLLPDVDRSNEHWVVGFDRKHMSITPEKVGKVFLYKVTYGHENDRSIYDVELFVEIFPVVGNSFPLTPTDCVVPGYYRISVHHSKGYVYWDLESTVVKPITKTEYLAAKKLTASTLSFDSQPSAQW